MVSMDFTKYIHIVPMLQVAVVVFFGLGMISILFLGIRIRYFQKALQKWMKENRRLSRDPVLDQIIRKYRTYQDEGSERTNTEAIIKMNYYKQKIFFIPIYYWEQFISKSEILSLFLGLLGTFLLVSERTDYTFFPLILGTILFIILVALETIFALHERKTFLFVQLEEYLDNSYRSGLKRTPVMSEVLKKEDKRLTDPYHREPQEKEAKKEMENGLKDTEIEWIIKQFYGEEKEV